MQANDMIDTRRRLLIAGAALSVPAFALGALNAPPQAAPGAGSIAIRRNLGALRADDAYVKLFRDAVGILRKRSQADPLSPIGWDAIAIQHALYCSSATPGLQVHWGWDFLTWHRAFLWSLERIMRDAVKEPAFALPYWDATRYRQIPAAYWGAGNPLVDVTREQEPGDEIPDDFLDAEGALSLDSFHAFGGYPYDNGFGDMIEGNLEQGFHNNVHNWIGGNMGMFATAGFDPLFSAHHNNVDRLWDRWRAEHPAHSDPSDEAWLGRQYTIVNEKAGLERVSVRDLVDTAALGYAFEDRIIAPRQRPDPVLESAGVSLAVQGGFTGAKRLPRILRFERSMLAMHPFCCRVFLRAKDAPKDAAYVGTFTILPVQRGATRGLDRNVVMQLALREETRKRFEGADDIEAIIVGVPLKGRNIPSAPLPLKNATLADGLQGSPAEKRTT